MDLYHYVFIFSSSSTIEKVFSNWNSGYFFMGYFFVYVGIAPNKVPKMLGELFYEELFSEPLYFFISNSLTNKFPTIPERRSLGKCFLILLLYSLLFKNISASHSCLATTFLINIKSPKKKCSIINSKAIKVVSFYFEGVVKDVSV